MGTHTPASGRPGRARASTASDRTAPGSTASDRTAPARSARDPGPGPDPHGSVVIRDVLLLGPRDGTAATVAGIALEVDGRGVTVSMPPDPTEHLLPWSSILTHVVEPWSGGIIPEWWVDPELHHPGDTGGLDRVAIDPSVGARAPAHAEPGALVSLRTPTTTYRFLVPDGDAGVLGARIADLAIVHHGPAAVSTVTTARLPESRGGRTAQRPTWYRRLRAVVTVVTVLIVAVVATLVLLQSAGRIHLPILGGAGPGEIAPAPYQQYLAGHHAAPVVDTDSPSDGMLLVQTFPARTPAKRSSSIPSGHATPGAVRPSW